MYFVVHDQLIKMYFVVHGQLIKRKKQMVEIEGTPNKNIKLMFLAASSDQTNLRKIEINKSAICFYMSSHWR